MSSRDIHTKVSKQPKEQKKKANKNFMRTASMQCQETPTVSLSKNNIENT